MHRKQFGWAVVTALILAPMVTMADETADLKNIMQGLRDGLVDITDGLLTGDFDRVATGATAVAEHPTIPATQVKLVAAELGAEMPAFKQLDTQVHDFALEIRAAARAGDHGAAASSYQRMVTHCFACHQIYKERVAAALGHQR